MLSSIRPLNLFLFVYFLFQDSGLLDPSLTLTSPSRLTRFLSAVSLSYPRPNPFHNFTHAFVVVQTIYALLSMVPKTSLFQFSPLQLFALFVSAIGHDVDHPGTTNFYHNKYQTCLAVMHPGSTYHVELHHASCVLQLLYSDATTPFLNPQSEEAHQIEQMVVQWIIKTDLGQHKEFMETLSRTPIPSTETLAIVLLKAADVSNELRPRNIAQNWVERLRDEFQKQGDQEREWEGKVLSVPTGMFDRTYDKKFGKNGMAESQVGFIEFILKPMFVWMAEKETAWKGCVPLIEENLDRYKQLQ
jgi:high affinity cGMP-specific 3',5'-cyclic phosphodiesterase 9